MKQDAVPGLTIPIWFVPTVTTAEMRTRLANPEFQHEIACAQLCGLGHARMRGFVTVLSADEFQKWMEAEEAKLKEQSEADAIFGKQAYPKNFGVGMRAIASSSSTVTRPRPRLRQESSTALTTIPLTNAGILFMRSAAASSHAIVGGDSVPYWIVRVTRTGDPANFPGVCVHSGSSAIKSPVIP